MDSFDEEDSETDQQHSPSKAPSKSRSKLTSGAVRSRLGIRQDLHEVPELEDVHPDVPITRSDIRHLIDCLMGPRDKSSKHNAGMDDDDMNEKEIEATPSSSRPGTSSGSKGEYVNDENTRQPLLPPASRNQIESLLSTYHDEVVKIGHLRSHRHHLLHDNEQEKEVKFNDIQSNEQEDDDVPLPPSITEVIERELGSGSVSHIYQSTSQYDGIRIGSGKIRKKTNSTGKTTINQQSEDIKHDDVTGSGKKKKKQSESSVNSSPAAAATAKSSGTRVPTQPTGTTPNRDNTTASSSSTTTGRNVNMTISPRRMNFTSTYNEAKPKAAMPSLNMDDDGYDEEEAANDHDSIINNIDELELLNQIQSNMKIFDSSDLSMLRQLFNEDDGADKKEIERREQTTRRGGNVDYEEDDGRPTVALPKIASATDAQGKRINNDRSGIPVPILPTSRRVQQRSNKPNSSQRSGRRSNEEYEMEQNGDDNGYDDEGIVMASARSNVSQNGPRMVTERRGDASIAGGNSAALSATKESLVEQVRRFVEC